MASENLAPETTEDVFSMVDVLREEEELEADANAVLGGSDDKNCTYPMGYKLRQALYACATCSPFVPAGICLACSFECHEGHDLYELYTKRNFRCDCGNSKFPDVKCKLYPVKDDINADNRYNHNFTGSYCTCKRPYPDPEDEIEDDMIQCVVCEDWYHGRHLGIDSTPASDDYSEMTCCNCVQKNTFLSFYNVESKEVQIVQKSESSENVEVKVEDSTRLQSSTVCEQEVKESQADTVPNNKSQETEKKNEKTETVNDRKNETAEDIKSEPTESRKSETVDSDKSSDICMLNELKKRDIQSNDGTIFWKEGWRNKLCRCSHCVDLYKEKAITFLIDESDTVHAYETLGKALSTPTSQYDKGMQALSNMNRVQQVEVLHGFMDLKSELSDYLKKFADNGKVVREEDIREFFTQLEARKRQRTTGPLQYLCK